MTKSEQIVRLKYPKAFVSKGYRGLLAEYQVWVPFFGFAGEKIGTGKTENKAWKSAARALLPATEYKTL